MSCPNCQCKDWTPVLPESGQRGPTPSLGARLASAFRALIGRSGPNVPRRQCLRCSCVYSSTPREDDVEEDLIAQRMAKIESQMSGFSNLGPLSDLPSEAGGLQLTKNNEMKCARCGHYAVPEPVANPACPNCGRIYDKVAKALKDNPPPKGPKSVSV
jgi:predicted RNA-binding Zn-ribbon protein involved in translation (DUF1610 family)